jgi:hypothetical protein
MKGASRDSVSSVRRENMKSPKLMAKHSVIQTDWQVQRAGRRGLSGRAVMSEIS